MQQDNKPNGGLEKFRALALGLGADEAVALAARDIPVDEQIVANCAGGRCEGYGLCAHCPPHAAPPAETRLLLAQHPEALLLAKRFPLEIMKRGCGDPEWRAAFGSIYKIVAKLEAAATAGGRGAAIAFAAGSCKAALCTQDEICRVLDGEACRYPQLARPSMEAVGIDVYGAMEAAGLDITRVGEWAKDEEAPTATLVGLVAVK